MARYHNEFQFLADAKPVLEQIHQYLMSEGYDYRDYRGEQVYKKGMGIAQGPTFMKIMAGNQMIVVEAWIKCTAVPGVYVGELGIDGVMAAIPKSILKTRVQYVEYLITQAGGVNMSSAAPAQPNMQSYMPVQPTAQQSQPVYSQPSQQPVQAPVYEQPKVQQAPMQQAPVQYSAPVQNTTPPVQNAAPMQSAAPAFCNQCGNRLTPDSKFCNRCGAKVQ